MWEIRDYPTGCPLTRLSAHACPGVRSPSRSGDDVTTAVVAHAHSSTAVHMTSRWRSCGAAPASKTGGKMVAGCSNWSVKSVGRPHELVQLAANKRPSPAATPHPRSSRPIYRTAYRVEILRSTRQKMYFLDTFFSPGTRGWTESTDP